MVLGEEMDALSDVFGDTGAVELEVSEADDHPASPTSPESMKDTALGSQLREESQTLAQRSLATNNFASEAATKQLGFKAAQEPWICHTSGCLRSFPQRYLLK